MDVRVTLVLTFTCLLNVVVFGERLADRKSSACTASGIAVYKVTMQTFWSRDRFAKQYPTYRPHAHWSRVIGRTHDVDYVMWRSGSVASNGIKEFAENGQAADLDEESQGYNGVFDMFSLPSIETGVGETSSYIFLKNSCPLVSLVSRIIPSPDWFVGLDSVSLCNGDEWEGKKDVDLRIWDAGTDKGLTFTSPNWPEVPWKPIEEITATHPGHPASSFYYDNVDELPTIARISFVRDTVSKSGHLQRDWAAPRGAKLSEDDVNNKPTTGGGEKAKSVADLAADRQGERGTPAGIVQGRVTENEPVGKKIAQKGGPEAEVKPNGGKNRKNKLSKEERRRRKQERKNRKQSKKNKRKKNKQKESTKQSSLVERKPKDVDCNVSVWGPWSECSKSCGYGTRTRRRTIITANSGRGTKCPPLNEEEICGTMRGCGWSHFSTDNWGVL